MPDDKDNVGKQDRMRVDINDKSEVERVYQQFPEKKHQEIVDAVKAAAPFREDIIKYLKKAK